MRDAPTGGSIRAARVPACQGVCPLEGSMISVAMSLVLAGEQRTVYFVGANFFDLKVVIAEGPGIHWLEKYQVAHESRLDPSLCKLKFDLASAAEHRADHDLHIVPQPGYQLLQFGFADAAELAACDA